MSIFLFIHMREGERKYCQEVFNEGKQNNKRYFSAERRASVQLSPCHNSIFFCSLKLEYFTVSRVLLGKKLKLKIMPRILLKRSGNVNLLGYCNETRNFCFGVTFYRLQSCLVFGKCINLSAKHCYSAAFSPNEFLLKLNSGRLNSSPSCKCTRVWS